MICNPGNEISASKAIKHIQLRLAAEKMPSIDMQTKTFEDTEKMIEHMRSRLKTSSQQRFGVKFY